MPAPVLFIPTDATWTAELAARTALFTGAVWWKIEVDPDGLGYDDLTAYLDNNRVRIHGSGSRFKPPVSGGAEFILRNVPKQWTEGDLADAAVKISVKIGSADYIQRFTGFVDSKGVRRDRGASTEDTVVVSCHDLSASRGIARKSSVQTLYQGLKICDTATPANSIAHKLAAKLGLAEADCDFVTIDEQKDYGFLERKASPWRELQDLALQHGALLGVRYDGKLRLISWTEAEWNAPTPEYVFDHTNVHSPLASPGAEVVCNRVTTEFKRYEVLPSGLIYKNFTGYAALTDTIDIDVGSGEYWPAALDALAFARVSYERDGEKFPIGTSIQTPTIGATGSGSDIEYGGAGTLTLESFNGIAGTNPAKTQQHADASEIILKATGGAVTITKLTIRGLPIRVLSEEKVEDKTAGLDDWDYRDSTLPGKWATSATQAKRSCERLRLYGDEPRKRYENVPCDFTPHVQAGAIVTFNPTTDVNMTAVIESWEDRSEGPHTKTRTIITFVEHVDFTASGSGSVESIVTPAPPQASQAEGVAAEIADRPTYDEAIQDGWDAGAGQGTVGTTTPDAPTLTANGLIKAVRLQWTKQLDLTNFGRYELQLSPDAGTTAYALDFGGAGIGGEGEDTDWSVEELVHPNIPYGGTEAVPTATTYHYRVRAVTKAAVASDWSDWVSATTLVMGTGDLGPVIVTEEKVANYAISPRALSGLARQGLFLETFDVLPATWNVRAGTGTETLRATGQTGGQALELAGYRKKAFPQNIPFDASKLYRIRCRARRTATADAAKQLFYCGVEGVAADGTTLVNTAGADSASGQHYICIAAANGALWALNEWQTFTGWFKGWGGAPGNASADPTAPATLHANVRYIRPLFIANYNGGPAGNTTELDYIAIDVFDEDGLVRSYLGINSDGVIADNMVEQDSILDDVISAEKIKATEFLTLQNMGLVWYLPLDEEAGETTVADCSGNDDDGTVNGAVTLGGAGASGGGAAFAGADTDYISAAVNAVGTSWAISIWIKVSAYPPSDKIFISGFRPYFILQADGDLVLVWNDSGPTFRTLGTTAGGIVPLNAWTHVVGIHDNSTNTTQIWRDGTLVASTTAYDSEDEPARTWYLGRYSSTGYSMACELDEPRVYSRALSEKEIKYLYLHPAGAQQTQIETYRLLAHSILAKHISTDVLNTLIAQIVSYLVISDSLGWVAGNYAAPEAGDQRAYMDKNELRLQIHNGADWLDRFVVAASDETDDYGVTLTECPLALDAILARTAAGLTITESTGTGGLEILDSGDVAFTGALSGPTVEAETQLITPLVKAASAAGLHLFDDGGTKGLTVLDSGAVQFTDHVLTPSIKAASAAGVTIYEDSGTKGIYVLDSGFAQLTDGLISPTVRAASAAGLTLFEDGGTKGLTVLDSGLVQATDGLISPTVRAASAAGLTLYEDGGTKGLKVLDSGYVQITDRLGVNDAAPDWRLEVYSTFASYAADNVLAELRSDKHAFLKLSPGGAGSGAMSLYAVGDAGVPALRMHSHTEDASPWAMTRYAGSDWNQRLASSAGSPYGFLFAGLNFHVSSNIVYGGGWLYYADGPGATIQTTFDDPSAGYHGLRVTRYPTGSAGAGATGLTLLLAVDNGSQTQLRLGGAAGGSARAVTIAVDSDDSIVYDPSTPRWDFNLDGSTFLQITNSGVGIVSSTTVQAANVYQAASAAVFYRSTSSLRYKTDVSDLPKAIRDLAYLLRAISFRSLCDVDDQDMIRIGFAAEDVAALGYPGLVHYVEHEGKLIPEGVQYQSIVPIAIAAIQDLAERVRALEDRG